MKPIFQVIKMKSLIGLGFMQWKDLIHFYLTLPTELAKEVIDVYESFVASESMFTVHANILGQGMIS